MVHWIRFCRLLPSKSKTWSGIKTLVLLTVSILSTANSKFRTPRNFLWVSVKLSNVNWIVRHIPNCNNRFLLRTEQLLGRGMKECYTVLCIKGLPSTLLSCFFEQDGAPSHYANMVRQYLDSKLANSQMGKKSIIYWLLGSLNFLRESFNCDFLWRLCISRVSGEFFWCQGKISLRYM